MFALSRAPLTLVCAAVALIPSLASASGTTRLGHPRMTVFTAKVPGPYSPVWDLSTHSSDWPARVDSARAFEDSVNVIGEIKATKVFDPTYPFGHNVGTAYSNQAGTFWSESEMHDPWGYQTYNGVFSYSRWMQSFRKDSANATCHFTISSAHLYTMIMTTGARAQLAADAYALHNNGAVFYTFHQDAGLRMHGLPPGLPVVTKISHGPMTFTEQNPDGIGRDYSLYFPGLTEYIDLSSVPIGGEFTVVYDEMTEANIAFDEVIWAYAYFRDPISGNGIDIDVTGLTPTDNPISPTVDVGPPVVTRTATLSPPRPNPSAGAVAFRLELPRESDITVGVFDVSGRRVAELARGRFAAGSHPFVWDARDANGIAPPAGVYFVRAAGHGVNVVQRVVRIDGR